MEEITTNKKSLGEEAVNSLIHTFFKQRTRAVVHPFRAPEKKIDEVKPFHIQVFDYDQDNCDIIELKTVEECLPYKSSNTTTWLNLEGAHKKEIETIADNYGIHYLLKEDIISYGQRPKLDEVNDVLFVLLHMLFYDPVTHLIEQEQISIVLGKNFVISFQEDARRDVFNPIRNKLEFGNTKLRQKKASYLFYSMIDIIVDSYLQVIEKVGDRVERTEERLMKHSGKSAYEQINLIRKDLILLKRNTFPVRDLIGGLLRSESELLDEDTTKYYKDVYDHIMQANDLVDNYRDLANTMQEMYFNSLNLRMNEVMKILAIVTTVMAPATVIGGIFGMNFDVIPYSHHKWGFYATLAIMLIIPIIMLWWFRKKGWFKKSDMEPLL